MLQIVSIKELQLGHYITRVVKQQGGLQQGGLQQGGLVVKSQGKIKQERTIILLREKGVLELEVDLAKSEIDTSKSVEKTSQEQTNSLRNKPKSDLSSETLTAANQLYLEAINIQKNFIDNIQSGAVHDLSPMKSMSEGLVENLFDHPNALSCLTLIKGTNSYLLEHSLNCSILMAMFAKHLGHNLDTVEALSLGALLMDVGMANVPQELLLQNLALSTNDWQLIREHVDHSLELVERTDDIPDIARIVISQHHERLDGSGYPYGLQGDEITLFGRMAAIVDTYDAMVSERVHQKALPPAVALKRLANVNGLDKELVGQFIALIGIHPVGSLVKLKSGKLGIVSKINQANMLKPVVMTFYSINGAHYNDIKRVDLSVVEDDIEASVQPSDFNINLPKFFRDVFINHI